ncbi:MAG: hypothetical protein C0412_18950 [Flavobacterium sp.]|nr:hypothetical protein [Flavobacterium sp.]
MDKKDKKNIPIEIQITDTLEISDESKQRMWGRNMETTMNNIRIGHENLFNIDKIREDITPYILSKTITETYDALQVLIKKYYEKIDSYLKSIKKEG